MKKNFLHTLIILVVCLLAFYQVAFLLESIKWDNLDSYLPMRYFVSECLRNNIFPLWLPYQGLGCPIFGDLISTNYPEAVFLGRLMVYDNIVFQLVFMGYIVLAGIGMYQLSRSLEITAWISLITAIAYALSGFIVGNAQHIQYIISAAWIPFVLKYYFRLGSGLKFPVLLKFILFTYLQASGGYPAHTIMLAYLLAFLFLGRLFQLARQKDLVKIRSYLGANAAALLVLGIMCFGIFLSIRQSAGEISRYQGMDYERTILNSFTPQCLISLISPLTPAACPQLFKTDLSMNNLYFGVIVLAMLLYGIIRPLTRKSWLFLITGIITLLLAMGPHFFLHRMAVEFLPLFKTFRHPSNIRLFAILSFLLVTGLQITRHPITEAGNFTRFKRIMLVMLVFLMLVMIGSASWIIYLPGPADRPDWNIPSLVNAYGFAVPLFVQSALALLFIGLLYLSIHAGKARIPILIFLTASEMILFTQLNASYTVYYKDSDPAGLRNFLNGRPRGFPLPDHHKVAENTDKSVAFRELWVNTNTYAKTVSLDFFYPFVSDGIIRLQEDTALLAGSLDHPLFYLAEKVLPLSSRKTFPYDPAADKGIVFIPDSIYNTGFAEDSISPVPGDTVIPLKVTPAFMKVGVQLAGERLCILLQNNNPGWKVFVDDRESDHFSVNHTLIGVKVSPGNHTIRYEFSNPVYVRATLLSFSLFLILFYLAAALTLSGSGRNYKRSFIAWVLPALITGLLFFFFLGPRTSYAEEQQSVNLEVSRVLDSLMTDRQESNTWLILNTESPDPFDGISPPDRTLYQRFRTYADLLPVWNTFDTIRADQVIYAWSNVIEPPEIHEIIRLTFPVVAEKVTGDRYAVTVYSKGTADSEYADRRLLNNFERPYQDGTYDMLSLDSNHVFSGMYADRLTPRREFGFTFREAIGPSPAEEVIVWSTLRFLRDGGQPCHLVITVNRKDKALLYHAVNLDDFCINKNGWNKGIALMHIPGNILEAGDELLVYCWNSGLNPAVYIDDFQVFIEKKDENNSPY